VLLRLISSMAELQLSVRSDRARDLARREHRSIADVVEGALDAPEMRDAGREPASAFYARLIRDYGNDLDLEAVIRENRNLCRSPLLRHLAPPLDFGGTGLREHE
jgi:hypothetical protein